LEDTSNITDWVSAHRRAVVLCIVLLIVIICWIRVYGVGEWDTNGSFQYIGFIRNIIDGLLSTIAVTFVIATFFWWVGAPVRNTPIGGEIPPYGIGASLNKAAQTAAEWEYFGHIGRDARCRVLPILGKRTKAESIRISIRFIIINPANTNLCKAYADYRTRSRSSTMRPRAWDIPTVQADLLATIVCLIKAKAEHPQLEIRLGLAAHFGLWRFDRSDEVVIVTQEEPQQPAYRYVRGSRFFAYHRQECEEAWLQSIQHNVLPQTQGLLSDADVQDELRRMLGRRARALEPLFQKAIQLAGERTFYA
jgi:hypothetical protein